jgi:hypothetical protein
MVLLLLLSDSSELLQLETELVARLSSRVLFSNFNNYVKCFWIFDCHLTQHFAVKQDACMLKTIDKTTVTSTTHSACCSNSSNPNTTEVAATSAAIAISKLASTGKRNLSLLFMS